MYYRDDLMSLYRATALNLSLLNVKKILKRPLVHNLSFEYSCYFRLISSIEASLCGWYVCISYTRVSELGFKFLFADVVMQWIVKQ